jgi:putative sigma-54 modulation protein
VQIKVSIRHGHLDEDTQQRIREKVGKLLTFFERLTMIEVIVDLRKDHKQVELKVQAEHKHDFVATEQAETVMAAVDLVLAKLEGQLRRYKEKIQDHRRTPSTGQGVGSASNEDGADEE